MIEPVGGGWRRIGLAGRIISLIGATGIAVEYGRTQVAFVAASDSSNVILSEHAEARTARRRNALRRFWIAGQRAVFDWHRQALRAQRNRKRVHAVGRLVGRRTDIAARAVMDNDRHARVHARVRGVINATERYGVSATGLDVPKLDAAAVRIGEDAVGTASHTRYVAVAQGGPYTFADI